jgi:integrase
MLGDPGPQKLPKIKSALWLVRHACTFLWIESGYNPKQIQRLMGHLFADAEADSRMAEVVAIRLFGKVGRGERKRTLAAGN